MSLLGAWGILFETDADKAKKDIDGLDKSLNDVESSSEGVTSSVDEMSFSIDESAGSFHNLTAGLGAAIGGMIALTGLAAGMASQAIETDEMFKFSQVLDEYVEKIDAWGQAVKRSGGTAEGFRGSLAGLNRQLTDISLTGGGDSAEVFARLGIDALDSSGKIKKAFDILPELATAFEGLSKGESVGFGEKLGLDRGTILMLQQGRVSVEELTARMTKLGVTTKEDGEKAAAFNNALADSSQALSNVARDTNSKVLPALTYMLKGFTKIVGWIKENKTFVTGFFIGVAGAITAFYLPAIISATVATFALLAPFIVAGSAIAALGLAFAVLYEDIMAFVNGQDSFIGDVIKSYERLKGGVIDAIDGIKNTFKNIANWFSKLFIAPKEALLELKDWIFEMIDSIVSKVMGVGESFAETLNGIKSFFGMGDDEVSANLNKAITLTNDMNKNPLNSQTSNSIVNTQQSSSRVNNFNIAGSTINTQTTDAKGVMAIANNDMKNKIAAANLDMNDGVIA